MQLSVVVALLVSTCRLLQRLGTTVFWHVAVNIAMVLGMLPVVGIPLPLVSYGGSSAVVTMASVGILLNVAMRKFVFQK